MPETDREKSRMQPHDLPQKCRRMWTWILLALYGRLEGPRTRNGRVLPLQQSEFFRLRASILNCLFCAYWLIITFFFRFAPCLASTSLPRRQEAWRRLKQIGSTTHILPCLYSPCVPSIKPVSLYHQGNCETFTGEVHALLSAIHEPPACAKIWGADPQRDRRKNGAAPGREGLQNHGSHLFEKFVIYDNCVACLLTHS